MILNYDDWSKNANLYEVLVGRTGAKWSKTGEWDVYENPTVLKKLSASLRGVSTPTGDLYIVDDSYDVIHIDIIKWMGENGKLDNNMWQAYNTATSTQLTPWWNDAGLKGWVTWQRYDNTSIMALGESIPYNHLNDNLKTYESWAKMLNKRFPKIKFVAKNIEDIYKEEDIH